jgi:hypothetical protein
MNDLVARKRKGLRASSDHKTSSSCTLKRHAVTVPGRQDRPSPRAHLRPRPLARLSEPLEAYGLGSRLTRGRNYARTGQVTELEVEPGIVLAKVQGSRYSPYRVRIRAKLLSDH